MTLLYLCTGRLQDLERVTQIMMHLSVSLQHIGARLTNIKHKGADLRLR